MIIFLVNLSDNWRVAGATALPGWETESNTGRYSMCSMTLEVMRVTWVCYICNRWFNHIYINIFKYDSNHSVFFYMGESGIHPKWWIHSCHWEVLQQSHIQGDEDEDEIESEWWSVLCRRASQYRPSLCRLMLIDLVMYRIDVGKIWKDVEGRFHAKSIERLPHLWSTIRWC